MLPEQPAQWPRTAVISLQRTAQTTAIGTSAAVCAGALGAHTPPHPSPVLCEVIGEPIKRLAEFIREPVKLTGKRALRKALLKLIWHPGRFVRKLKNGQLS